MEVQILVHNSFSLLFPSSYQQERPQQENDYSNMVIQFGKKDWQRQIFHGIRSYSYFIKGTKDDKSIKAKKDKIKREMMILQKLQEGPNIIGFYDVLKNKATRSISFVFEHVNNFDHRKAFKKFSDMQIREYIYKLLEAVHHTHSQGIMHRDIKPFNVVFDASTKNLRLIDWGLADFYLPTTKYNTNVCALYYKPPEILLSYSEYNQSVDMWGIGVILAQMFDFPPLIYIEIKQIFQREPFFYGKNQFDQLEKITRVLGTQDLQEYINKYKIPIGKEFEGVLSAYSKQDWQIFVNQDNKQYVNTEVLSLLDQLLKYDHEKRISAGQALKHVYFRPYLKSLEKDNKIEK